MAGIATAAQTQQTGCVCPIHQCLNGCDGRGRVEVYKGQAVACHPINAQFLVQPRVSFTQAISPASLPCQQPADPKKGTATVEVGEGRTKEFRTSVLQSLK